MRNIKRCRMVSFWVTVCTRIHASDDTHIHIYEHASAEARAFILPCSQAPQPSGGCLEGIRIRTPRMSFLASWHAPEK
jgi:hypothetical protein